MNQPPPNEALDLANLRVRLRDGLNFDLHENGGEPCYIVKNQTSSEYFQIGIAEYAFISLLDGSTTVQGAVQEIAYKLGEDAFSVRDALGTAHWLIQNRLADRSRIQAAPTSSFDYLPKKRRRKKITAWFRSSIRCSSRSLCLIPGNLFQAVSLRLGWIASKSMLMIWSAVIFVALICAVSKLAVNRQCRARYSCPERLALDCGNVCADEVRP